MFEGKVEINEQLLFRSWFNKQLLRSIVLLYILYSQNTKTYFILNALLHSFEYVFTYVYSTYISNTHMHKYIQVNFLQDEKTKNY